MKNGLRSGDLYLIFRMQSVVFIKVSNLQKPKAFSGQVLQLS